MLPVDVSVRRLLRSISLSKEFSADPIIQKIKNQNVRELSGGERRYLEMAIIFSLDRDYILLDEPFTGVEPIIVDRTIERIKEEAKKGKGILITDHLHRYITRIAEAAYVISDKQCFLLEGDIEQKMKEIGYLH